MRRITEDAVAAAFCWVFPADKIQRKKSEKKHK